MPSRSTCATGLPTNGRVRCVVEVKTYLAPRRKAAKKTKKSQSSQRTQRLENPSPVIPVPAKAGTGMTEIFSALSICFSLCSLWLFSSRLGVLAAWREVICFYFTLGCLPEPGNFLRKTAQLYEKCNNYYQNLIVSRCITRRSRYRKRQEKPRKWREKTKHPGNIGFRVVCSEFLKQTDGQTCASEDHPYTYLTPTPIPRF